LIDVYRWFLVEQCKMKRYVSRQRLINLFETAGLELEDKPVGKVKYKLAD